LPLNPSLKWIGARLPSTWRSGIIISDSSFVAQKIWISSCSLQFR
jgi:hypothetical protein